MASVRRERGFTLLEVLVVLLIVGIMVSFAALSIGDGRGRALEQEARRFQALVGLAGDEAVLRSRELGLAFNERGYTFLIFTGEDWAPLATDRALRPRTLEEPFYLEVSLEGLPAGLAVEPEVLEPHVLLLSSGEATPFDVTFRAPDHERAYRVTGTPTGRVSLEPVDVL